MFHKMMTQLGNRHAKKEAAYSIDYSKFKKHGDQIRELDSLKISEVRLSEVNLNFIVTAIFALALWIIPAGGFKIEFFNKHIHYATAACATFVGFFASGLFLHTARLFHYKRIRTFLENENVIEAQVLEQRGSIWGVSSDRDFWYQIIGAALALLLEITSL